MNNDLQKARELIERHALGKRVAVATSGGEDSMALLCLMLGYAREGKLKLVCINVEHGIREASRADSDFVRAFCEREGIEFVGKTVDIPALCKQSKRGVECEAHFVRSAFYREVLESGKADLVATAHHARDNAETVLLHIFRGCGIKGLCGMETLTESGLFRPLLTTSKEEICAYVQENNIAYVTDETNADTAYDRNFIRHEILPKVRERFPAAERSIGRLSTIAGEYAASARDEINEDAFVQTDDAVLLDESYLTAAYIIEALARLGKDRDVYISAVEAVAKLKACRSCARVDLGGGVVAAREYGAVAFYYRTESVAEAEKPFVLPEQKESFSAGGKTYFIAKTEGEKPTFGRGKLYFDGDKLPAGCVIRARREGDRFTPFGGGSRKLKEYLIDKKIPARLRGNLRCICLGAEVYALLGVEISDKIKVDAESKNVYMLTCAEDGV